MNLFHKPQINRPVFKALNNKYLIMKQKMLNNKITMSNYFSIYLNIVLKQFKHKYKVLQNNKNYNKINTRDQKINTFSKQ